MEAVWRFRIMLGMAFAIIIFGDFLGYGSIKAEKHINRQAPTALREKQPELHLEDGKKFYNVTVELHPIFSVLISSMKILQ